MATEFSDFALQLKPVFDACDYNGDGYVAIQDLISLGLQQAGAESNTENLELILKQLDRGGNGSITFEEFSKSVQEWLSGQLAAHENEDSAVEYDCESSPAISVEGTTSDADGIPSPDAKPKGSSSFQLENNSGRTASFTESEGYFEEIEDISSHSTTSTNDYCGDLDETGQSGYAHLPLPLPKHLSPPKNIYLTYPPNGIHKRKPHATIFEMNRRQLSRTSEFQGSADETFVAFTDGEGNKDDSQTLHYFDMCESPSNLSMNRRLSGVAAANQLRQVRSANASLYGSAEEMTANGGGQLSFSDSESNLVHLSEEIKKLSSQVSLLKLDQDNHSDKQRKLRDDNKHLVNRINALEEQLENQKVIALHAVEDEAQKYRRELLKIQRDNIEHIEQMQLKLFEAEKEIGNLKTVEPMLRKEIELSLEERRIAQKKVEDLQAEIIEKEKEVEQLKYKLKVKADDLERERSERVREVLALQQEIENLRYMKSAAINHYDEKNDLAKQLAIIKQENDKLKRSQEELRQQLLEQGTMYEAEKHKSLADELLTADKGHVLDALRNSELENLRLRQYIEQLLLLIMQTNPNLLEK